MTKNTDFLHLREEINALMDEKLTIKSKYIVTDLTIMHINSF